MDNPIMIEWLAGVFGVDRFAAGFLIVCLGFVLAGLFTLYVSYQSRIWERAHMKNPPEHPLFPNHQHH